MCERTAEDPDSYDMAAEQQHDTFEQNLLLAKELSHESLVINKMKAI
jgi:hypothetical protein